MQQAKLWGLKNEVWNYGSMTLQTLRIIKRKKLHGEDKQLGSKALRSETFWKQFLLLGVTFHAVLNIEIA